MPADPREATGRFDDLVAGRALTFTAPVRRLVARTAAEVAPVLDEVDRAAAGGLWAYGFVAYEAAAGLDPRLGPPPGAGPSTATDAAADLPLAHFVLAERALDVPPVAPPSLATASVRGYSVGPWHRGWTEASHRDAVLRIREYIAAGETYQLNYTVALEAPFAGAADRLYADLALAQGGAHAAYLDLGRHVIASASPELFFEWRAGELVTRPMKGTARRGATPAEDARARAELLASPKERAENVMIVDLLRNDLGRLADIGTVRVPELVTAEGYRTVWQLTSTVVARPRPGTGLLDVFRALFPSGSVTGAPKVATMELIRGLEPEPRGVYCGAVGVVAPRGHDWRARFNVAIRTVTVDRETGRARFGVGGGITWASDPAAEHAEVLAKAAILDRLHR